MIKKLPKISVIIPVFNAEKYIERCVRSIMVQSFADFEVLLINDGSVDNSGEICEELCNRDERFNLYSQKNEGPSAARNYGISLSKGSFIAFVDADDYVDHTYLQSLYDSITSTNAELSCMGYYEHSKYHKHPMPLHDFLEFENIIISQHQFLGAIFKGVGGGVLWGKLFNSSIIFQNNLMLDPKIRMYEDTVFVLEYAFYCKSISIVEACLYHYNRENILSISSTIEPSYIKDLLLTNHAIEYILSKNNIDKLFIDNIIKDRSWTTVKMICFTISSSNYGLNRKITELRQVTKNKEVASILFAAKEKNTRWIPHLFFLKNNLYFPDVAYTFVINILILTKKKFRK